MKPDPFKLAQIGLVITQPFFSQVLLRLKPIEDETCQTAWTDGVHLGYNPKWFQGLDPAERKFVLAHEAMHVALLHFAREGSRDHGKWNRAGDYAINGILVSAGLVMPKGGLRSPQWDNWNAEAIYAQLPDEPPGDGADPGGCGETRPHPGHDAQGEPQTVAQAAQEIKQAVAQAAATAKRAGKLPAGLERLVEEITTPKIPWREVLARFVDEASRNDYSWGRPNRRYAGQGIILPTLHSQEMGRVALFADTSGSISHEDLVAVVSEILGILELYDSPELLVLWIDSKVARHQYVGDLADLRPKGGGGTDFRPGFAWLEKEGESPVAIIYLTDGHCSRFPADPGIPTIWALTEKNPDFRPPFGETVTIQD